MEADYFLNTFTCSCTVSRTCWPSGPAFIGALEELAELALEAGAESQRM